MFVAIGYFISTLLCTIELQLLTNVLRGQMTVSNCAPTLGLHLYAPVQVGSLLIPTRPLAQVNLIVVQDNPHNHDTYIDIL